MRHATFLLGKDPYAVDAGDTRISRLLLEVAGKGYEVSGIALASGEDGNGPVPIRRVRKPDLRMPALLGRSVRRRRSLIHTRFNTPELVAAVAADSADVLVAEHTYMAEPVLEAAGAGAGSALAINTHVLESSMLATAQGPLGALMRVEARRTWSDELRCVRAAASTACLGADELNRLRDAGAGSLHRLDLVLEPAQSPATVASPRALFVGDRQSWPPNRDAYEALLELWPKIHTRVPSATLAVAGTSHPRETRPDDPSVELLGFVPRLDDAWRSAGALLAPVSTGGGVRVKILDAARHGVPVVATPAALGSIGSYLPLEASRDEAAFMDRAATLLSDRALREREGRALYDAAAELWGSDFIERQVGDWLEAAR